MVGERKYIIGPIRLESTEVDDQVEERLTVPIPTADENMASFSDLTLSFHTH